MRSAVAWFVASARSDGSGRKPGILAAPDFELVAGEVGMAFFAGTPEEHADGSV
jgi:hypothetical protein